MAQRAIIGSLAALALQTGAAAAQAQAGNEATLAIEVCNHYRSPVVVAASFIPVDADYWVNEGWWHIASGDCLVLDRTRNLTFYLRAELAGDADTGWWGDAAFCVIYPGPFRFEGVDGYCPDHQTLVEFQEIRANHYGTHTWHLNR